MPLVAGVDSSTTACKIEVRDADTGELVATGRAPHPPTTPPRSEQDPSSWWRAFEAAATEAGLFDRHRVAAVAVAGQQHGLVVLDDDGGVIRPAKLWNDTDSAPDAEALLDGLDARAWAEACGTVPVASLTITKLRWLRRTEPSAYERIARILLPHDWLTLQLTGAHVTDRGDASGTGWWSPSEERYRPDLLALVDRTRDWDSALPTVLGPSQSAGEWSRLGAVVGPGTGDNMAAALGLGLTAGDLALSIGTSGTAFTVADTPAVDPSGTVAGFADATGRFLPLVCTLNATKVTDTIARLLGVDHAQFAHLARSAPPGAEGLVLVPHFDGERTPDRPSATGTVRGLRSDVTPEALARASVEGVVCNLLAGADALAPGGIDSLGGSIVLVGGASRSAAYRQIVADLTGRPVVVPVAEEMVARGAAIQACAVLRDVHPDDVLNDWGSPATTTDDPDPRIDRHAIRAAYADAAAHEA